MILNRLAAFGCSLLLLSSFSAFAQKKNIGFEYHIHRATSPIRIDGVIDEPAWQAAERTSNFFMVLPMDTSLARVQTTVRMTYDMNNLYLVAECFLPGQGRDMVESLRRDFSFVRNDNFIFFLDPFEDQTSGFSFGANAAGGQWDGLMYEGGKVDLSWDNKWTSVVKRYGDKYVLELAIPFKTLRYKKDVLHWGVNFSRNDLKTTEKSAWAPVPRQFPTASLAYTGVLVWDVPPPPPGPNISVIPYVLGGVQRDYGSGSNVYKKEIGGDAKIAVTSSLNLDLTVNPDFSQVDVDKEVIDLSRYELFYPEKRQFFLENADHFNNLGYPNIRPFFSRRIGLGIPIEFGARLSGKLDPNWRIGLMDMQTRKVDSTGLPEENYSVLALQRKVFSRSNIGFIFINKQAVHYQPGKDTTGLPVYSQYNRNAGIEFNLASSNNYWTGKFLLLKAFSPGKHGDDWVHAGNLQYLNRHWLIGAEYEYTGVNYNAEVGYVPRTGYFKVNPQINYLFLPSGGVVLSHGPQLTSTYFYNEAFHRTDNETIFTWLTTFRNRSTLAAVGMNDYVQLLAPFDPTNTGIGYLATGTRHHWNTAGIDYVSKPQALFTWDASFRWGGYYADGNKFSFVGDVGYRIQPFVNFTMAATYTDLTLPHPWGHTHFWLVGPKLDITMTNTLFLTAYVQYNQQTRNMNLNTRLQWRYKPASDLFLVYTDNYLTTPFSVRNRAVVLKFNYWWNL